LFELSQALGIISLARDCRFISGAQKDALTASLENPTDSSGSVDIHRILVGDGLINDAQLEDLFCLEHYRAERDRDLVFGRLAVANGFCSKDEVARSLVFQAHEFDKNGEYKKLGDILVNAKIITTQECFSVLLTQNRIKDTDFASALEQLEGAKWKTALNRRFGAVAAVQKGVDIQKVNQALAHQQKLENQERRHRFIGEIMVEMNLLSNDDVTDILMELKQYEQRRMDLEKALFTVKDQLRIVDRLNRLFRYSISRDGLEIVVEKKGHADDAVTVYEMLIWLRRAGIRYGIVGDAEFSAFLKEDKGCIRAARGLAPVKGGDETIRFLVEPCKDLGCDEGGAHVNTGDILAEILPGTKAKYGINVFGGRIAPDPPESCGIESGIGVTPKGKRFTASVSGRFFLAEGKTLIVRTRKKENNETAISGCVDTDTGDTYENKDVTLSGTLTPEGVLSCRELSIRGQLQGKVLCRENVYVKGAIGYEKKKDCPPARILCGGNLHGGGPVIHARIEAMGRVIAPGARVIASQIIARQGMVLESVLSDGDTVSMLYFGLSPEDDRIKVDDRMRKAQVALSSMRKEKEQVVLDQWYEVQSAENERKVLEQFIFSSLIQIIDAPELYQHEGLEDKIRYLEDLPDYSSVKQFYWKIPNDEKSRSLVMEIINSGEKDALDPIRSRLKERVDPNWCQDGDPMEQVATEYRARCAALENEVAAKGEDIDKLELKLEALRTKRDKMDGAAVFPPGVQPQVIEVKNECAAGTVIMGRQARLILEKKQYRTVFKEVFDPAAGTASIIMDTCW